MIGSKNNATKLLCAVLSFLMCTPTAALAQSGQKRSNQNSKDKLVEICHLPPGNPENAQTIKVSESALRAHIEKHGDYLGPCSSSQSTVEVCDPPIDNPSNCSSTFVDRRKTRAYLKKGAYVGNCNGDKVRVCHVPPGNPSNAHSIEISRHSLNDHLSHGDFLGDCPKPPEKGKCPGEEKPDGIVICHIPRGESTFCQTIRVCCGSLDEHLEHGDYMGACEEDEDDKILICHFPPGNPNNPVSIYIKKIALSAHIAHGDHLGSCAETESFCGNGIIEPANNEQCDDAGESSFCNADCTFSLCGDGKLNPTAKELCDDGNTSNDDACLNTCVNARCGDGFMQVGVEQCDGAGETATCNRDCTNSSCGDGKWNFASGEQCDDGNNNNGDGCDAVCQREFVCGNGLREGIEECDDGNQDNTDGCTNSCHLAKCGDTFVRVGIEECDDGNLDNSDGCLNICKKAACQDGHVHLGFEQCDLGPSNNSTSCLSDCSFAFCGDGYLYLGVEECDDGNRNNTDACLNTCKKAACGDGFVYPAREQCDDGNFNENDDCLNTCQFAWCGDGVVYTGVERCDEGIYNGVGAGHCLADCSGVATNTTGSSIKKDEFPKEGVIGVSVVGAGLGAVVLGGLGFLIYRAVTGGLTTATSFKSFFLGGTAAQGGAQGDAQAGGA